jgi:hypothetical protein
MEEWTMTEWNAVEIREFRDQISTALKALIVLSDAQYIITATWAAHTHVGEIDGQPPMSFPPLCERLLLDETRTAKLKSIVSHLVKPGFSLA